MDHQYYTSKDCRCTEGNCFICSHVTRGGLGICKVCNGMEGSLTTHCCGRPLTGYEVYQIYNEGVLDYRDGFWVHKSNPTNKQLHSKEKEKPMKKRSFIIRSKEDPSKQMHFIVDADNSIGIVQNSGLEILVIENSYSKDFNLSFIDKTIKLDENVQEGSK